MKKMKELMEELGFNAEASDSVKKAFIANLIKSVAEQERIAEVHSLPVSMPVGTHTDSVEMKRPGPLEQLSFVFEDGTKKLA